MATNVDFLTEIQNNLSSKRLSFNNNMNAQELISSFNSKTFELSEIYNKELEKIQSTNSTFNSTSTKTISVIMSGNPVLIYNVFNHPKTPSQFRDFMIESINKPDQLLLTLKNPLPQKYYDYIYTCSKKRIIDIINNIPFKENNSVSRYSNPEPPHSIHDLFSDDFINYLFNNHRCDFNCNLGSYISDNTTVISAIENYELDEDYLSKIFNNEKLSEKARCLAFEYNGEITRDTKYTPQIKEKILAISTETIFDAETHSNSSFELATSKIYEMCYNNLLTTEEEISLYNKNMEKAIETKNFPTGVAATIVRTTTSEDTMNFVIDDLLKQIDVSKPLFSKTFLYKPIIIGLFNNENISLELQKKLYAAIDIAKLKDETYFNISHFSSCYCRLVEQIELPKESYDALTHNYSSFIRDDTLLKSIIFSKHTPDFVLENLRKSLSFNDEYVFLIDLAKKINQTDISFLKEDIVSALNSELPMSITSKLTTNEQFQNTISFLDDAISFSRQNETANKLKVIKKMVNSEFELNKLFKSQPNIFNICKGNNNFFDNFELNFSNISNGNYDTNKLEDVFSQLPTIALLKIKEDLVNNLSEKITAFNFKDLLDNFENYRKFYDCCDNAIKNIQIENKSKWDLIAQEYTNYMTDNDKYFFSEYGESYNLPPNLLDALSRTIENEENINFTKKETFVYDDFLPF
jgi:hypothetical protein